MENEYDALRSAMAQDLGITHLNEDEQSEIINKLGEVILKRVTISLLEKLPEDKRDAFEALSVEGDQKKIQDFLSQNIPNFDALLQSEVQSEIARFKEFAEADKED